MSARAPRRHCPQCEPPEPAGTPPPELAGKSCTATIGTHGPICGQQAVTLDDLDRPVCNVKIWTNLGSHEEHQHRQPVDPSLAPVAQDPPAQEPAAKVSDTAINTTAGDLRAAVREELDVFSTEVLRIPATMGQKQTALHPVGLCDDGRCKPCRAQRRGEHSQARKILAEEIDQAIEYKGRGAVAQMIGQDGADGLAEVLEEWRDAGRPEPSGDADEQIEVVR